MALITFINNERLTMGSSQLVYGPEEINSLYSVIEQAELLQDIFSTEIEKTEAACKAGYEAGYEEGQTEGYEAALEHIAVKLVVLAKEASSARDELEESAAKIALKIVEKIAGEVGTKEMIAALAQSAAKDMVSREPVVLRVHPENFEYMKREGIRRDQPASRIVEVVSDPGLSQMDCVLETEFGQIKAGLQTQLKVLSERLYGD